ncbi:MAG: flagellar M-ring protein FliF, partial [Deltaproteobacteria bacterium]|nr:flagellar M-ring protein FliF [Deltaproteobacteria bacterium]
MGLRQLFLQLKTLFQNLSPSKRATLLILIIGTVAGFSLLMTWTGRADFQPLYSNLVAEDAGIIIGKLKEQKIPYRITGNGNTILVPQEHIHEMRMNLASEGLPQGGNVGFEVFDNTKLGMTEFAQNVNYQRALQGELSRTINRFSEVESSRVHIVMSERSLFIEDEEPATASVVLKLHPGKWLNQHQVNGIIHLVSSSVPRLSTENVTVVDSRGKLLSEFKAPSDFGSLSSDQLEYQEKVERSLENRIKTMLEKALGPGKAIVRLSADLNFKRQEKTEERYFPENQVIRSEQLFNEKTSEPEAAPEGIPGIRANLPQPPPENNTGETTAITTFEKQDRTVNYEIGKITSHVMEPIGEIERISVAVLVDGTYKQIQNVGGELQQSYTPRSAEEMLKLENICKRAVNFDEARGDQVEVVNIPFETTRLLDAADTSEPQGWLTWLKPYQSYLKYVFLGL